MSSANQAHLAITETGEEIARIIENVSPLVLALCAVHMSGSLDIIRMGIKPKPPAFNGDMSGSLSDADAARLRRRALEIILAYRSAPAGHLYTPSDDELHEMICFLMGLELPGDYVPVIREDMALDAEDPRAFKWRREVEQARKERFPVAIVGAGMSGMLMALRLKQAGIPFTIYEKNKDIGGTWYENKYPGLRVDVPSHSYSFSFMQDHRWKYLYSFQNEILEYFKKCYDAIDISNSVRFGVEVTGASWNEVDQCWDIDLLETDGTRSTARAKALVSATGFFNRPSIPDFKGASLFKGRQFHSARWPDDVTLQGKRVAIIGNAATTLQMVPPIAEIAEKLTVFQRSPSWTFVNPEYGRELRDEEQWALTHIPFFAGWMRTGVFNWTLDLSPDQMMIDPQWPQDGKSTSAANEEARVRMTATYIDYLGDRPDLLEKLLPTYPPYAKRPTISNGNFFQAVKRDNVEIVTEAIDHFTETGIVDASGRSHDFDVIIYATGYKVQDYLEPMVLHGRGGLEIRDFWQERPGGFLGIAVPHFPNFFMMYGPGTNLGYNGNLIFHSEMQARFIAYAIREAIENKKESIEVRAESYSKYIERVAEKLKKFVWSTDYTTNYYRNSSGYVTTNSPWSLLDMWNWTREPNPADFELHDKVALAESLS